MERASDFKHFLQTYKYGVWFLAFVAITLLYFPLRYAVEPVYAIWIPLDDAIPFLEIFIIPYAVWYVYVYVGALYILFESRAEFLRLIARLLLGVAITYVLYLIFPNTFLHRPETFARDNVLVDLIRWTYANDPPRVVCPSIHCLNAIAVFLAFWRSRRFYHKWWFQAVSFVTMALCSISTVFVKQHSIVDVFCAVALSFALHLLIYRNDWKCFRIPQAKTE